ncbi:MAG: cation transporter [Bacteroidales bacterium]|nr:cation transporter [Bacteroidales bacterium]
MRTVIFLVTVFVFIIVTPAAFGQSDTAGEQTVVSKSDTLEFTVYGMDCPGCEGGLEKQVNKMESVQSSEANWRKQQLKVVPMGGTPVELKALEKRIKKANFTLDKKALKEDE